MPKRNGRLQLCTKWEKVAIRLLLIAVAVALVSLMGGCPIRRFWGISCPGCGMTRACAALLRLDFQTAAAYHPLVFVLIPGLLYVVFREFLPFSRNRKVEMALLAAFLFALVAVYCYRMLISHAAVLETDYSNSVFYRLVSAIKGWRT